MKDLRTRVRPPSSLLALGLLVACDPGPVEPPALRFDETSAAFVQLAEAQPFQEGHREAPCPDGGHIATEGSRTVESVGDGTVHKTWRTTRYEACRFDLGSSAVTASGELTFTIESHLESEDAAWPDGVLFETGRQVGFLTLSGRDPGTVTCEYDLTWESEPATGRVSYRGMACGVPIHRDRTLPPRG